MKQSIIAGADPEIFQRGVEEKKFWKKNVSWYMYERVHT